MSLILVGIHCYLGIHVLARGVIFVDLALAQIAVLGSMLPGLLIHSTTGTWEYAGSLLATTISAIFLTLSNRFKSQLSQEAMIGIVYAFASATTMLLFHAMPHGHEHMVHTLAGQILFCGWKDVFKVLLIYSGVSVIYILKRKDLMDSSTGANKSWVHDFLFYALFGVVISSSVKVAGVLIVFTFLIVPSLLGSLWFQSLRSRLIFGWVFGTVMSFFAMLLSYHLDLPTGPAFVVLFTLVPILCVPIMTFKKTPNNNSQISDNENKKSCASI